MAARGAARSEGVAGLGRHGVSGLPAGHRHGTALDPVSRATWGLRPVHVPPRATHQVALVIVRPSSRHRGLGHTLHVPADLAPKRCGRHLQIRRAGPAPGRVWDLAAVLLPAVAVGQPRRGLLPAGAGGLGVAASAGATAGLVRGAGILGADLGLEPARGLPHPPLRVLPLPRLRRRIRIRRRGAGQTRGHRAPVLVAGRADFAHSCFWGASRDLHLPTSARFPRSRLRRTHHPGHATPRLARAVPIRTRPSRR